MGGKGGNSEICSNLLKYYHRPIALLDPGDMAFSDSEEEACVLEPNEVIKHDEETAKFISVGTQTDYRESEAQTDPWDPPYKIENKKQLKKLEEMQSSLINELNQKAEKRGYILKNMWKRKNEELKKKREKLEGKLRKEINAIEHLLHNEDDSPELPFEPGRVDAKKYILSEEHMDYLQNNFLLSNFQDLLTIKDWLEKKQTSLKSPGPLTRLPRKTQRELLCERAYQDYLVKKKTKTSPKVDHKDHKPEESPLPTERPVDEFHLLNEKTEFLDIDNKKTNSDKKKIDMATVEQQFLRELANQKQMLNLIEKNQDTNDSSLSEDSTK